MKLSLSWLLDESLCGYPGLPNKGILIEDAQDSYREGDLVSYNCEEGSILYGQRTRKCQSSGRWSGQIPMCSKL